MLIQSPPGSGESLTIRSNLNNFFNLMSLKYEDITY